MKKVCPGLIFVSLLFFLGIVLSIRCEAKYEKDYQREFASRFPEAQVEYILPDKARIDILTPEYAIEVDYAKKWAEAIGQALYYARCTGRYPAILLIVRADGSDDKYVRRLHKALELVKVPVIIFFIEK